MTTTHTQGRLTVIMDCTPPSIVDKDGFAIFGISNVAVLEGYFEKLGIPHWADDPRGSRDLSGAEQDANARRLAACWNAFDGVATDEIEGKDLAEIISGMAYITGMQGGTIGLEGGACGMLASQFAGQFKGSRAVNFLELRMGHPEVGDFTVTMQRTQGETPGQQLAARKAEIAELLEALKPFIARNSSEETITITVKTADVARARAVIAQATERQTP